MTKLICSNFGFDCDYVAKGEIEQTIDDFKKHTFEEHGIDYSKEALFPLTPR